MAIASYLGRTEERYNATHVIAYKCYPGQVAYYLFVHNFYDWIEETTRGDLCTVEDVVRTKRGAYNYSSSDLQSNYHMEFCKSDLVLFLASIGLLSICTWLLFIVPLPDLATRSVESIRNNDFYNWAFNYL